MVSSPDPDLEAELIEYCRANLATYKCPRTIEFDTELPRDPNGKLYKRRIRDRYWQGRDHASCDSLSPKPSPGRKARVDRAKSSIWAASRARNR